MSTLYDDCLNRRTARRTRLTAWTLGVCLAAATVMVAPAVSHAAEGVSIFWKRADLLRSFFKTSKRVVDVRVPVDKATRAHLSKSLGYTLPRGEYVFYVGLTDGRVDGYALIDEQMGQHLPITFATKIRPDGKVDRVEVVIYREPIGDEVRDSRFREQFVGKTAAAPLRVGRDIVAVSAATISSHAIAIGVRRALVLTDELMRKGTALAARLGVASL